MGTPLDWIRQAASQLPPPAGQTVNNAVDVAEGIIFADGSLPPGTNPADIYSWFHDGPGTAGYERARDALNGLAGDFPDYTAGIRAAQREISAGWTGTAAENCVRSFQPLLDQSGALERHATNAGRSVAEQITSFTETRNRVVPVPAQPPSGPGMNQFTQPFAVDNYTADAAVAQYQLATYNNQDAYSGYQGQTTPQGRALPQEGGTATPTKPTGPGDPVRPDPNPPRDGTPGQPPPPTPPPVTPPPGPKPPGQPPGNQGSQPPGSGVPPVTKPPGTKPGGTDPSGLTPTTPSGQPPAARTPAPVSPGTHGGFGSPGGAFGSSGGFGSGGGWAGSGGLAASGRPGGDGSASSGRGAAASGPGARTGSGSGSPREPGGRGGSGTAGRTGAAGGQGMGGSRGQGDEDREHASKFVLRTDHESEFVGELPPHSPSVIGGSDEDD